MSSRPPQNHGNHSGRSMPFELEKLCTLFPNLDWKLTGSNSFEIEGMLPVKAQLDDFVVNENFEIKITANNFPSTPPICRELSHKVFNYHKNDSDSTLCVGSPHTLCEHLKKNPSIIFYIDFFLIPYLFGYRYHQSFGFSPFGELAHGGEGLLSEYRDLFKLNDLATCSLLTYGTQYLYRGHHLCPCGSGLYLRKCHGTNVRDITHHYTLPVLLDIIMACYTTVAASNNLKGSFLENRICTLQKKYKKYFHRTR